MPDQNRSNLNFISCLSTLIIPYKITYTLCLASHVPLLPSLFRAFPTLVLRRAFVILVALFFSFLPTLSIHFVLRRTTAD